MDPAFRARLERVYAEHPLTADAVLDRVRRSRGTLDGISARDLAEAADGGVTDQNHAGGAAANRALAAAVGLAPGWAVLDIATGLGGTPRLLAEEFGCRCHGVELTAGRFRDAVRLTRLVGLDDRVTFSHGDFMDVDVPGRPFDLALCQGAAMHFPDMAAFLRRAAAHLGPGGWLAIEDAVIVTPPSTPLGEQNLERLLHIWNGRFQRRDDWPALLSDAGFHFDRMDDETAVAIHDLDTLLTESRAQRFDRVNADERQGWELGLELLRAGILASVRILATRAIS
jgi:cyclopropane fatty-acyl-phospholipid synthase-like methyltransferase